MSKCSYDFYEGTIISFRNPSNGREYDGVVWRVMPEDETNFSLFIRFVDTLD